MVQFIFKLVGSLAKVFPDGEPPALGEPVLRGFAGEALSVQLAYSCRSDDMEILTRDFSLQVESDLPVTLRTVGLVPVAYPCHAVRDAGYLRTEPGLFPDLLLPYQPGSLLRAVPGQWRSVWADVDGAAPAGEHSVLFLARDSGGAVLWQQRLTVSVSRQSLPPQTLLHTEWLHTDCLADYYRVPVFSEAYWRITENFVQSAVRHGVNMLLTPVFTPPLDMEPGGSRTAVQLVGIRRRGGAYAFDFSRLQRWTQMARRQGVAYLEMAHLFSQWGAVSAPTIYADTEDGPNEVIFGWSSPAAGGAYTVFLQAFLPALKAFLQQEGWLEHTWFHISDEPEEHQLASFARAADSVRGLLAGCHVLDALSSYAFYQKGLVARPVVSVDHAEPFLRAQVPHLWVYYCMAQAVDVPNRFMALPSGRNRILGVLLYYFNIEGFLHWGFDFYNSAYSRGHIDPYRVTDGGEAFPSGDAFLVYPAPDGTAYESVRGMVLRQALDDLRLMRLLEEKLGRPAACRLLEDTAGMPLSFTSSPVSEDFFTRLRARAAALLEGV